MTSEDFALAPAGLAIEVYTTPGRPFASAATPEGPGDDPTWSPSSATLIYGDHDAVLVDTLITYAQVDALADWIETKGGGSRASTSPTARRSLARAGPADTALS